MMDAIWFLKKQGSYWQTVYWPMSTPLEIYIVGFNLNSFQCIQAESVELVYSFNTILLIGQKMFR